MASIDSLKDVQQIVKSGQAEGWGQIVELPKNKNKVGLRFPPYTTRRVLKKEVVLRPIQEVFHSAGFTHPGDQNVDAISEGDSYLEWPCLAMHGEISQNWTVVDVPSVIHLLK